MPPTQIVVASHNLMHGLRLGSLIPHYVALREGPDLPSARIAAALGPDYAVVADDACPGLAFVHDARTLACEGHAVVPLPLLRALNAFERLYIVGGKTKQKFMLLAEIRPRGGAQFAAA